MKHLLIMLGLWLSLTVGAMAQPALDQSGSATCSGCGGSTTGPAITLSTTGTNELVLLILSGNASSTLTPITWTPSGCGLTWAHRATGVWEDSNNHAGAGSIFWAWAAAQLTSCTVTTTANENEDAGTIVQFSLTGVGSSMAPFDSNGSLPTVSSGNINPPDATISTNEPAFLFSVITNQGNDYNVVTPVSGISLIQRTIDGAHNEFGLIDVNGGGFGMAQTSLSCCTSGNSPFGNQGFLVDAISGGGGASSNRPHMIIGGN